MAQEAGRAPFITLIMPVYNAEKYLRAAIDSVLAQTFSDYELLLVDDCSPDGSGAICDEYARSAPEKIRVLHLEKNGDSGVMYNDPDIGIEWPFELIGGKENLIISEKDLHLMSFADYKKL